jgi:Peptidase S24-like.
MRSLRNDFFFEEVEKFISQGESVEILVRGKSMTPYLRDGIDKVVLSPVGQTKLQKGDIVLFYHSGSYLLHRIIRREEDYLIIQGDGNIKKQEKATFSDIKGIVKYKIRPDGKFISVKNFSHRFYWRSWLFFTPLRRYLLAIFIFFTKSVK